MGDGAGVVDGDGEGVTIGLEDEVGIKLGVFDGDDAVDSYESRLIELVTGSEETICTAGSNI